MLSLLLTAISIKATKLLYLAIFSRSNDSSEGLRFEFHKTLTSAYLVERKQINSNLNHNITIVKC